VPLKKELKKRWRRKGGLDGNNEGEKHLIGCHSAVDMAIYMPQLGSVFNS